MNLKVTLYYFTLLLLLLGSEATAQQNYLMTPNLPTVNSCNGFLMDSGGGTAAYAANQNLTTTICPAGGGGTHVQLVFGSTDLVDGDELCFFDGPNTASPPIACASDFSAGAAFIIQASAANASGCLTVTFNSDAVGQGQGWSADINCIPSCQTILAILDNTDPIVEPADTGWIDVCPGERVFFYGSGSYPQDGTIYNHSDLTSDFEWDFGDGVITYGPTVSHVFDEPGGYIVQLEITDQLGCKNTNFLSQRVRVAPPPDFSIGGFPTQICVGDTVALNAMVNGMDANHTVSVMPNEGSFQTIGIRSDSLALPDGDGSCYETSISFSGFAPGQVLTDISDLLGIFVNMEHSYMRDLEITLTCPNGQSVILHNHAGQTGGEVFLGEPYEADEGFANPIPGTGYDYGWASPPQYNQTWIQYANTHPGLGTLPEGTYNPFQPLTNFLGCPLNGDWEIEVCDHWGIDNGYIFSWSIEFDPTLYPSVETFTPTITTWEWNNHPSIIFSMADSLNGSPFNAGEVAYTFTVHDSFGCSADTTVNIQVLPETHPLCHTCEDLLTPAPDTIICAGESIAIDVTSAIPTTQDITFESYDNYEIGAINHPVANPYLSVMAVNSITPTNITTAAQDLVSICLDITTDFVGDLRIHLRAPNNQLLELSTTNGGNGDNYTQTCFTPTAITPITSGTAPFTGTFRPEGNWAVLNGSPINGNWTLQISDAFGLNTLGKVNWWAITFRSQHNITYAWSPSAGLSCNNCPTPTANPSTNANYIVTATDNFGCVRNDTVAIDILSDFAAPTVTLQLAGSGQMQATWNDINPGLPYEVNVDDTGWVPSNDGNLSHLITGLANGDTVNVQVRTLVTLACTVDIGEDELIYFFCPIDAFPNNPGPYAVNCQGVCDEAVQISVVNGTSPFDFVVTNTTTGNSTTQTNGNLTGMCPGNYLILVTDAAMCQDTVMFTVNNQPALVVTASQTQPVSCANGTDGCATVNASGGVGNFTYQWNNQNQSTQQTVCGLPVGPVTVTATDANGCSASASVSITGLPALTVNTSKIDVKCKGDDTGSASVVAAGGSNSYTYQWSAGTTPATNITGGLEAGIVSVTVTDTNGCQAFGTVTINEPATVVEVEALQTVKSCYSANTSVATATSSGGTGPYTFLWSPGGQTTGTASNLSIGQYTVTTTDTGGCTATDVVDVEQWEAYNLNISATPPTCNGNADGQMNVVVLAGGDGTYTFLWSNGATSDFLNDLQGGVTYTVTVTDGQGCTGTGSRFLVDNIPMELTLAEEDTKCAGTADGSATVANVAGGTAPFSYQWNAAALNQTTITATDLEAGTYEVVVTDAGNCTASATITVGEPDAISIDFVSVNNECFGNENGIAEAEVEGGVPGYSYQWSNGASAAKLTELAADTYYLTVTDANSCTAIDSIFISAPERVEAELTVKNVSCFEDRDGSISITPIGGTPPFTYSLDGQQFYGSSTLIALEAGDYRVYIKDAEGCVFSLDTEITEPPQMSVDILVWGESESEYILEYGDSIPLFADVLNGQGSTMFVWDASYCGTLTQDTLSDCEGTLTSSAVWSTPNYSNDYFVLAIDSLGCEAEDHLQVHVKKTRRVVVPTGFTPNGNQPNDLLLVHGKSGTTIKVFQVFDRWGELLFQDANFLINDPIRGWDGTFKSKDMPPGVYAWYLEAEYEDGLTESFKGETTLIR